MTEIEDYASKLYSEPEDESSADPSILGSKPIDDDLATTSNPRLYLFRKLRGIRLKSSTGAGWMREILRNVDMSLTWRNYFPDRKKRRE